MNLSSILLLLAPLLPAQAAPVVIAEDFRGKPLSRTSLSLVGPGAASVAKIEPQGLRVVLSAGRTAGGAVGVQSRHALRGDFEITGSYEVLAAEQPMSGYGVGVNLMISPNPDLNRMARLARFWVVDAGSCYQADFSAHVPLEQAAAVLGAMAAG